MVVINADDFGLNESVNAAIVRAFKGGLCSSTTLMATMPGFEEACELAHTNKLLQHVGMHLVLRDGLPLTAEMRRVTKFCDKQGQLSLSMRPHDCFLSHSEKRALAGEARAQIKRCRAFGIPTTHLDSHHHIHSHLALLTVLLPIARSEGIPYVRIARNIGDNMGFVKKCYKYVVNHKLFASRLAASKYFGSAEDYLFMRERLGVKDSSRLTESLEVMVHPQLDALGQVVNSPGGRPLFDVVSVLPFYRNAVSFSGSRYI